MKNFRSISFTSCLLFSLSGACEQLSSKVEVEKQPESASWNSTANEMAETISKKAGKLGTELSKSSEEVAEIVSKKVGEVLKDSKETLPAQEIKKLQQFEYKVVELPIETNSTGIESSLNTLGRERWDCSYLKQSQTSSESLRFLCKRRPFTPLRFIPRTF